MAQHYQSFSLLAAGRLSPGKDMEGPLQESDSSDGEVLPHGARRSWRAMAGGLAMVVVVGVCAVLGGSGKEESGSKAPPDHPGEERVHPLFSALYDPHDPPSKVDENIKKLASSFQSAQDAAGMMVPVDSLTLPFRDETLITLDISASSMPIGSLPGRTVTIDAIASDPPLMRASIASPESYMGWATMSDLSSFYTHLDKLPDPAGCAPTATPSNVDYVVLQNELPVTSGASSRSTVVKALARNDVVWISEVRFVASEQKLRGRLSGGHWVTVQNQRTCENKMAALPAAPSRGLLVGGGPVGRRGSFLVVGDWGWDPDTHWTVKTRGCQEYIAFQMLQKYRELGDVQFVINVGDSFYPGGVKSADDEQWQTKFRDVFHEDLRTVPWYSVYGNHDLHVDPCSCNVDASECAQVNADKSDRSRFYMPSPNFYVEHGDLNLEVVALDTNHIGDPAVCQFTTCSAACPRVLSARHQEGTDLFWNRIQQSQAKNLVIFSHYPTDYLEKSPFLDGMRNDHKHNIVYFGGHRHSTDQNVAPITPHQSWLVGGGGGMGCDGPQGFVVGEIQADYSIRTYSVMVPAGICCA